MLKSIFGWKVWKTDPLDPNFKRKKKQTEVLREVLLIRFCPVLPLTYWKITVGSQKLLERTTGESFVVDILYGVCFQISGLQNVEM